MNVKAIPSMDKSKLTENTLQLAIISRIKLYYRPAKLALPPDQAAEKLRFRRSANSLTLINPTPYYLTVTELNAGTRVLENALNCLQWAKARLNCLLMREAILLTEQ